jgi:hypothetical protein
MAISLPLKPEAKEQERIRLLQAQKQKQETIDREKMRKDNEALEQREKQVEPVVKEKPIRWLFFQALL